MGVLVQEMVAGDFSLFTMGQSRSIVVYYGTKQIHGNALRCLNSTFRYQACSGDEAHGSGDGRAGPGDGGWRPLLHRFLLEPRQPRREPGLGSKNT